MIRDSQKIERFRNSVHIPEVERSPFTTRHVGKRITLPYSIKINLGGKHVSWLTLNSGTKCYVDSSGRIIVGMYGSTDPPLTTSTYKKKGGRWVYSATQPPLEGEAIQKIRARENMVIAYAGSRVCIDVGEVFYITRKGKIIIGWHGTYNPPVDMNGRSLISRTR